jgi:hypothetical protein
VTSSCPEPDCSGTLLLIGPSATGPNPDLSGPPTEMECTEGHVFPVFERKQPANGETRYRIGAKTERRRPT